MSLVVHYWPCLARASGMFRMLAEAGVEYEHQTDMHQFGCALWDPPSSNIAPPKIVDGEIAISQAPAVFLYLGEKCGFDKGVPNTALAMQYIMDMSDWHSLLEDKATAGVATNNVAELQKCLEDRYIKILGAIEHSIVGPYFFGEEPTYVDFAACTYLDMAVSKYLAPLEVSCF